MTVAPGRGKKRGRANLYGDSRLVPLTVMVSPDWIHVLDLGVQAMRQGSRSDIVREVIDSLVIEIARELADHDSGLTIDARLLDRVLGRGV